MDNLQTIPISLITPKGIARQIRVRTSTARHRLEVLAIPHVAVMEDGTPLYDAASIAALDKFLSRRLRIK